MTDSTDRDSQPESTDAPEEARDSEAESVPPEVSPDADAGGSADAPVPRKKRRKKRRKVDDSENGGGAEELAPGGEQASGTGQDADSAADGKRKDAKQESKPGWFAEHYLKADPRWLGVFRIVLGVILSVDLIRRWVNAEAF